jgi:hypothetical protein
MIVEPTLLPPPHILPACSQGRSVKGTTPSKNNKSRKMRIHEMDVLRDDLRDTVRFPSLPSRLIHFVKTKWYSTTKYLHLPF